MPELFQEYFAHVPVFEILANFVAVLLVKGAHRGSSKKSEKICVARWDHAIYKSSFSELSYVAFSQNSLSNSPRFASLAYSYFVVYISNHIKMTDKIAPFTRKLHMRSSATVILHANPMKT